MKCDDKNKEKKVEKKKALHKMVEALIKGDSEEAATHLHDYLTTKTREILVGEAEEGDEEEKDEDEKEDKEDEKEEKSEDKSEEKDEDEDEKEEKEEVEEGFGEFGHGAGAMSRTVSGKVKYENGGKSTVRKHDNAAPELEPKVKDKVKFKNGGKSTVRKHGNAAPGLEPKTKGEFLK